MKTLRLLKTENAVGKKYTYRILNGDKFLCEKKSDKDYVAMSVDKTTDLENNKVYAISHSFPALESVGRGNSAAAFEAGTFYGIAYLCAASTPKANKPVAAAPAVAAAVAAVPQGTEPHTPGKIEQIIALHKAGKTNKEIIAAGFNKSTVGIQVRKYIKAQADAAAALLTTQLKKAAAKK